jgi:hypothetical protein
MALSHKDVKRPVLPKRAVDVPELGGEVIVRGLLLKDRLAIADISGKEADFGRVSRVLAATVIDGDGRPLLNADEWEEFGAAHFSAAMRVFEVALELSGFKAEVLAKNS